MTAFLGFRPGLPFHEMAALTMKNHRIGTRPPPGPFTVELMLAIFWEESPFFKNRRQFDGGRGVGFGQVERQELPKLTTARAREHGYFVPGVNSHTVQLDDDRAVQIASCTLLQLWYHPDNVRKSRDFALHGYGGVGEAAGTGVTARKRLKIIQGWKDCEAHLRSLFIRPVDRIYNSTIDITLLEDEILSALRKSRQFNENVSFPRADGSRVTFRELVFPPFWYVPTELIERFLPTGMLLRRGSVGEQVKLLQHLLNGQEDPPEPRLATDRIFGPKTHGAVVSFQRSHRLVADGIVGPRTRGELVPSSLA